MKQEFLGRYYSPQRFTDEKSYSSKDYSRPSKYTNNKNERKIRSALRGNNDFNELDKAIDNTLKLFESKRSDLTNNNMRREYQSTNIRKYGGDIYSSKNYEAGTNSIIKDLKEQVAYLKDQLEKNEWELNKERALNRKLISDLECFKQQDVEKVKEQLLKVVYSKLDSGYISLRIMGNEGISELIEIIENLIEHTIKVKEEMEIRFEKFLRLHNMQVEVNRKRSQKVNIDDKIIKCESEIKQLNFHEL